MRQAQKSQRRLGLKKETLQQLERGGAPAGGQQQLQAASLTGIAQMCVTSVYCPVL